VNFGYIVLDTDNMRFGDGSNRNFEMNYEHVVHEALHILGFSTELYETWINPSTGNPYGSLGAVTTS